jgi:hypothetical protein
MAKTVNRQANKISFRQHNSGTLWIRQLIPKGHSNSKIYNHIWLHLLLGCYTLIMVFKAFPRTACRLWRHPNFVLLKKINSNIRLVPFLNNVCAITIVTNTKWQLKLFVNVLICCLAFSDIYQRSISKSNANIRITWFLFL